MKQQDKLQQAKYEEVLAMKVQEKMEMTVIIEEKDKEIQKLKNEIEKLKNQQQSGAYSKNSSDQSAFFELPEINGQLSDVEIKVNQMI